MFLCLWARDNQMFFKCGKCKAMVFNRSSKGIIFKMESKVIKIVKTYKYLGVQLSSKRLTNLYTSHFKQVLLKAERRLHCIRHYGFHKDGLRMETAVRMYKLLVRPILEYGAQVLIYRNYFLSSKSKKSYEIVELATHAKKLEQIPNPIIETPAQLSPLRANCYSSPFRRCRTLSSKA